MIIGGFVESRNPMYRLGNRILGPEPLQSNQVCLEQAPYLFNVDPFPLLRANYVVSFPYRARQLRFPEVVDDLGVT